jgi:hypothetical protein
MADSLNVVEPQILAEARAVASTPALLAQTPAGRADTVDPELRMITTVNGGTEVHSFFGESSFVKRMGRPGRRVTGFYTPNGYITTNGRMMR